MFPEEIETERLRLVRFSRDHVELETVESLEIVDGQAHRRLEHLEGYGDVTQPQRSAFTWRGEPRGHLRELDWLVRGTGEATATWWGDRIGRVTDQCHVGN
ncbi:MAG: hypothetical protein ABEN55_18300 [Bradymonadaceae bacterium]